MLRTIGDINGVSTTTILNVVANVTHYIVLLKRVFRQQKSRKCFFSINVETKCNTSLKIFDIAARWPGSTHNTNILLNSRIYSRFCENEFGESIIAADSGYPNKSFIATPLISVKNAEDSFYSESQIGTRKCIERSNGV